MLKSNNANKIVIVLGPTASGKSNLAILLAKYFNGEVISADSRQVYKDLDIGTGKLTLKEQRGAKHHLLSIASPKRVFTVTQFQKKGSRIIKDILKKHQLPIIAGGTGLYIDALISQTEFPDIKPNPTLRKKLNRLSVTELFSLLKKQDPKRAANIESKNPRRLIRALEIIAATKKPISPLIKKSSFKVIKIGLKKTPNELRELITARFHLWLEQGLLKEVKDLHEYLSWSKIESFGLEYKYVSLYLQNKIDKNTMIEKSITSIYRYAKRQLTWWKKDKSIHWINSPKEALNLTKKFLS